MPNRADTYTRGDNASSIGSPSDGGGAYSVGGTWGISSNRAYNPGHQAYSFAVLDAGMSDCEVQATNVGGTNSQPGICCRWDPATGNGILLTHFFGTWYLQKNNFGITTLGSVAGSLADGSVMKLLCNGSAITGYLNGSAILGPFTDSFQSTNTQHGLLIYWQGGAEIYLDDLSITSLAVAGGPFPFFSRRAMAGGLIGMGGGTQG